MKMPFMGEAGRLDSFIAIKIWIPGIYSDIGTRAGRNFSIFCISWCFPNRVKAWPQVQGIGEVQPAELTRNYYALRYPDAFTAADYFWNNQERLERQTRLFYTVGF